MNALAQGDVAQIAAHLHNDLQEAASRLHEGVAPLLAKMREEGALAVLVSGSGPTVAGLAPDAAAAQRIAGAVARTGQLGLVGARPGIVVQLRSASELGEDGAVWRDFGPSS